MKSTKKTKDLPKAETPYTVDPLSDLVTASELRAWRNQATTKKVLRYLGRWRQQVLEYMGEGGSIASTSDATAAQTVEASSKAQILKDIIGLEAEDIAVFYGLDEPKDADK